MANKRGRGCKCCGCSCSDLYITGVRIAFDTEDCPTDYGPSFPAIPETCYKWVGGTYDLMLDEPLTSAVYKAENCPTKCVWKYFDPCELVDFSGPGLNAKAFPMIATSSVEARETLGGSCS